MAGGGSFIFLFYDDCQNDNLYLYYFIMDLNNYLPCIVVRYYIIQG